MLWHQVELIDKLYALNFRAPFMLVQGAAEIMKREGTGGSVVSATTQPQSRGTHLLCVWSCRGVWVRRRSASRESCELILLLLLLPAPCSGGIL